MGGRKSRMDREGGEGVYRGVRDNGNPEVFMGEEEGWHAWLVIMVINLLNSCKPSEYVTLNSAMFPLGVSGASHCSRTLEVVT